MPSQQQVQANGAYGGQRGPQQQQGSAQNNINNNNGFSTVGRGGGAGGMATDKRYERGLIEDVTAPGGVRQGEN